MSMARRFRTPRRADWPVLAITLVAGILALRNLIAIAAFILRRPLEGDFALYYIFARIGLHHGWGSLYDLAAQRQEWHALGPTLFYPEIYTPPVAWLVAPFALLPFPLAIVVWTVLLIGALAATWWLCAPRSSWPVRWMHLALAGAVPVVAFGLLLGQVVVLVAAAIAVSFGLMRRRRPFTAGLVLSLIALKPQLAFLVPLALLLGGHRRVFLGWLCGSGGILAGCLLTLGSGGLVAYGSRVLQATHSLDTFVVPVQLTLAGILGQGLVAHLAQLAVTILTLVVCWRRRDGKPEFPIAAGITGSLLVTPFIHAQDLGMLVPAAWLSLRTTWPRFERTLGLAGYLTSLALATPLPLLMVLLGWTPTRVAIPGGVARRNDLADAS
jgi:hypothetical protein